MAPVAFVPSFCPFQSYMPSWAPRHCSLRSKSRCSRPNLSSLNAHSRPRAASASPIGQSELHSSHFSGKPPGDSQPPTPDLEQKRRDVGRLLRLFTRLAAPYWRSEASARRDLAALLALALLQSGVSVMFSYISRDFWTALNTKDIDLFYRQAQLFFAALVAATPVVVYYQYLRDACSLRWRQWITTRVFSQYCSSRNFYHIESNSSVDNPDQRIAQDLKAFTTESIAFILTILISSVDLVCFSFILFSIYPILFGVLLLYASTGTIATAVVGKQLISLNYQQLVREADLRYGLVRMRENAESIAFFQGEKREKVEILQRLQQAVDNMVSVINLKRRLSFLQTGYKYAVQVLPALCVAPRYFAGEIQLGSVTQSFSAFSHILGDLSLVVNRFDSLSNFGAGVDRLAEFVQVLERDVQGNQLVFEAHESHNETRHGTSLAAIKRSSISDPLLRIDRLTLFTPTEDLPRKLISNLSVKMAVGQRLLVTGPSGTGKSSLLRAIAGLWNNGSGLIECPIDSIFFIPQKPYCTLGTLRANLVYPNTVEEAKYGQNDAAIKRVLQIVDLKELPKRMGGLEVVADWSDTLSLGEQQRLQFARLLLSECKFAVIDEGTSALSVDAESRLYEAIKSLQITVVSVGHRPSLLNYHTHMLRLGQGSDNYEWEFSDISQEQTTNLMLHSL